MQNIHHLLLPGGQVFFNAITKTPIDEAYDNLDKGKWGKYENWRAHTSFHNDEDPKLQYEYLLGNVGFSDCQLFKETFTILYTEESFEGNSLKYAASL